MVVTPDFLAERLFDLAYLYQEWYYWITVIVMFLIHVGFCMYEVGVSRRRNMGHTLMKNAMLFPTVIITFYLFGWWIYGSFAGPSWTTAFIPLQYPDIVNGWDYAPWSPLMTTHMQEHFMLAFWAAFLLFSLTEASIVSGAVIERIRTGAFVILAVLVGSGVWIWLAAQAWSPWGWTVKYFGTHDAYASGIIHTIAGFFTLGVLINLGPRIGKFDENGNPREIPLHNQWLTCIGLFLIYTGFWGFYFACNIPTTLAWDVTMPYWGTVNIYGNPTNNSAIGTNFLLSLTGGLLAGYWVSKGNPFWTFSGGLAGVIAASAGNDLYHPMQAFILGFVTIPIIYRLHYYVEKRFKIDDAVGACAVHGYSGVLGLLYAGVLLWGYPAGGYPFGFDEVTGVTSPWGNAAAAVWEAGWGFIFGFVASWIMKKKGLLRVPPLIELAGLDRATPAIGEMYPYFPEVSAKDLSEFDQITVLEAQRITRKARSTNPGRNILLELPAYSKDSGRKDYLGMPTTEEMVRDAIRLEREMRKEAGK
jgi:ammonia channel protein AmtB